MVLDFFSMVLMFVGSFFLVTGSIGLLRLRDTYSRLHAITKADVLGFGFIVLACIIYARSISDIIKLFLIWLLVILYSGFVGYAIANRKAGKGDA